LVVYSPEVTRWLGKTEEHLGKVTGIAE